MLNLNFFHTTALFPKKWGGTHEKAEDMNVLKILQTLKYTHAFYFILCPTTHVWGGNEINKD